MEDKRFQPRDSSSPDKPERSWQEELYNDEDFEEMKRIRMEIDLLIELQETTSRPFRF